MRAKLLRIFLQAKPANQNLIITYLLHHEPSSLLPSTNTIYNSLTNISVQYLSQSLSLSIYIFSLSTISLLSSLSIFLLTRTMSKTDIDTNISLEQNAPTSYALSGKIMLSAIVILFAVVVFMIALHIYARWYLLRVRRLHLHRRRARRQRASQIVFYVDPNSTTANRGLDAALLSSLPVFVYSSSTHPETLDCAVCLSEFEENEAGRVLPKCHHSFHTDCIDMWFRSHSTCPICRAPVETHPVQPVQIRNSDFAEAHELSGSSSGVCSMCNPNQTEGEKINTTSLADRRKGLDLAGVKIEVPRRTESFDELRLSSPASLGFRSPGNRLQSLKRILSMGKKPAANSPSSGTGTSCLTAEFDVELGRGESTYGQTRTPTPR